MKSCKTTFMAMLFAVPVIFTHCVPDQTFAISTEQTLMRNGWAVEYFFQDQELTGELSNYRLSFSHNGTFICRNKTNNEMLTGHWNRIVSAGMAEIIGISITSDNQTINKLSGSWSLVTNNGKSILLEDQHPNSVLRLRVQP